MAVRLNLTHAGPPYQLRAPKPLKTSCRESEFIETEISRLLEKGVIVPSEHEKGEFLSSIFVTPKKDGSYRLILNLKKFNKNVADRTILKWSLYSQQSK